MQNHTVNKDTMNNTDKSKECKKEYIGKGGVGREDFKTDTTDGNQNEDAGNTKNTNKKYEKKDSEEKKYLIMVQIIFAIFIVMLSILILTKTMTEEIPEKPTYFKEIEKLKPNYSPQTDDFWNIIKSFPYFLLSQENPENPAVLLMVTPAGSLDPALQLSKQLAQTINNFLDSHPKGLHHVNGAILSTESPDVQKRMIDEQIRTMVDNHKQRVVVVVNLEKIDPKAIMIFHGYCDNSEAVYKNIAIILLLELPAGVQAKDNEDVYTHLSQIWGSLGKSRTQALFSRMANNIAILKTN